MSEEQVKELLEEIAPEDNADHKWIDCSEATGYSDDNQYERIVAALKQNVELLKENKNLKQLNETMEQAIEAHCFTNEQLLKANKDIDDMYAKTLECMKTLILLVNETLPKDKPLVRIKDYEITYIEDDIELTYKPLPVEKQVTLEIKVIENDTNELCPICNKELGQYPAISRKDDKTKICSECGTLEALKAWEDSLNDKEKAV